MLAAAIPPSPFSHAAHDHGQCVDVALAQAEAVCARRKLRFTELRRRVLELVWASHMPIGAYELMERLSSERGRVAPPTVYRALAFLTREGLIHRLDSLNAFTGCTAPQAQHRASFLICRHCRTAAELQDPALIVSLDAAATSVGFKIEHATLELLGLCARCHAGGAA